MLVCRRCGKRPAYTSDGFCLTCKRKEVMKSKLQRFDQIQRGLNRTLSGGIVD